MTGNGRKKEWSVVLFGLVVLVIFPPVITIYDQPEIVAGVPLSFLVLFVLWGGVICATALGACRSEPGDGARGDQESDRER